VELREAVHGEMESTAAERYDFSDFGGVGVICPAQRSALASVPNRTDIDRRQLCRTFLENNNRDSFRGNPSWHSGVFSLMSVRFMGRSDMKALYHDCSMRLRG
jgi:hypothetical protein